MRNIILLIDESAERREMLRIALLAELSDAEKGMDLIDFCGYADFSGVLRNILYGGMPKTAQATLSGEKTDKKRKDRKKGKS